MSKKYPRFHGRRKYKGQGSTECDCCTKMAIGRACIEFTYMRGEDEDFKVCEDHFCMASKNIDMFLADYRNKIKENDNVES